MVLLTVKGLYQAKKRDTEPQLLDPAQLNVSNVCQVNAPIMGNNDVFHDQNIILYDANISQVFEQLYRSIGRCGLHFDDTKYED